EPKPRTWRFEDCILGDAPALVAHVAAETNGAPLAWIGHSFGSVIGLCWLARQETPPPEVKAVVALGTPGPGGMSLRRRVLALGTWPTPGCSSASKPGSAAGRPWPTGSTRPCPAHDCGSMTTPPPPPLAHGAPALARLDADTATPAIVQALRVGAVLAAAEVGIITLTGPGALECVQGLLTSDLDKPGDGGFVYGALLTPKGMIVVDGWAARQGAEVRFTTPAPGEAVALFTHSVPPRLARVGDRSADYAVLRLAG